jgi:putative addiction module component (TIGR02574 family)
MNATAKSLGIDRLSIPERIALVESIWDSITSDPSNASPTAEQLAELERRCQDDEAFSNDVVPWETIKDEARARWVK